MNPISPISPAFVAATPVAPVTKSEPGVFQDLLVQSIQNVEKSGADAQHAVEQFLSGESDDVHRTAMLAQRAELSSELFLQVRNKVVQAYQEIMRMQM